MSDQQACPAGGGGHASDPIHEAILKPLRRHLAGHGLTPDEYRTRYGLKADYPMVAESYSQARRDMAKKIGLGRKPGQRRGEAPAEPAPVAAPRGRRKAATNGDA